MHNLNLLFVDKLMCFIIVGDGVQTQILDLLPVMITTVPCPSKSQITVAYHLPNVLEISFD